MTTSRSKLDDSTTAIASLRANTPIKGWPSRIATPTLIFRCQEGDVEAYVATGLQSSVEDRPDVRTALIRIDAGKPFRVALGESTTGEALFFRYPANVALELEGHNRMLFRFIPFNSPPQETTFDLRGLNGALSSVKSACAWDPKALLEAALAELRSGLTAPAPRKRVAAAREVGGAGRFAGPVVPTLVELLSDADLDVRVAAATALGRLGQTAVSALPDLRRAAADPGRKIRVVAEEAIGLIESPEE